MGKLRDFYNENDNYLFVDFNYDRRLPEYDLNDLQKAIYTVIKRLSGVVLKEGAIFNAEATITQYDDTSLTVFVSAGLVNWEGKLIPFEGASFVLQRGNGVQVIFVECVKRLITATQDGRLTLPTTGEATADRHKYSASLTLSPSSSYSADVLEFAVYPAFKVDTDNLLVEPAVMRRSNLHLDWLEGLLPMSRVAGIDSIMREVEERFYNSFGSYIVSGFDVVVEDVDEVNGEAIIGVSPGVCYVLGKKVAVDQKKVFRIPLGIHTKTVNGETKVYTTGQRAYKINNSPVKRIIVLYATVERTDTITRGSSPGGQDLLPYTPVVQVVSVSQGTTTFRYGTDYVLSGNAIDWSPAGREPNPGTTYTVVYRYRKPMVLDADYTLNGWFGKSGGRNTGIYYYFVSAVNASNNETAFNPNRIKAITVERGDIVKIDWDSVSGAVKYRVYVAYNPSDPTDRTQYKLLDEVVSTEYIDYGIKTPQTDTPVKTSSFNESSPVILLEKLEGDYIVFGNGDLPVANTEFQYGYEYYVPRYDLMYVSLEGVKRVEGAPADSPKPPTPYVDTVPIGLVYFPAGLKKPVVVKTPLRAVHFDELLKKFEELNDLKYNVGLTIAELDLYRKASGLVKGLIFEDFSGDVWADTNHPDFRSLVDVESQIATHETDIKVGVYDIHGFVKHTAGYILPYTERVWFVQDKWTRSIDVNPFKAIKPPSPKLFLSCSAATQEAVRNRLVSVLRGSAVGFVQFSPELVVIGSGFNPDADVVISVEQGGRSISLGVVKADWNGNFRYTTVFPNDISGVVLVRARDNGTIPAEAEGTIRISEVVATVAWAGWRPLTLSTGDRTLRFDLNAINQITNEGRCIRGVRVQVVDPVAYSFFVSSPIWITSVGLYFTQKDASIPVYVQIKPIVGGLPGDTVIAEASVFPNNIRLNEETKITFKEPVRLQPGWYCIVVLSESDQYKVQASKLGEIDMVSGQRVLTNPSDGVLFVSANGVSWSIYQDMDLRCKIYVAEFQQSGEYIAEINEYFTHAVVRQMDTVFDGVSVEYYYKTDTTEDWQVLGSFIDVDRKSRLIVKVRANASADRLDSPVLAPLSVLLFDRKLSGVYVSRAYEFTKDVSSIELYVSHTTHQGTSLTVKASNDDGRTWITLTRDTNYSKLVDGNLGVYEYKYTGTFPTSGNRVRIRFEMSSALYSRAVVIRRYGGIVYN